MIQCNDHVLNKLMRLLWDDQIEQVACLVGNAEGEHYVVMDVLPAENEDYRPAEEFFISGRQMARIASEAERRGYQLLGVAHTHLPHHPAFPSEADVRYCKHAVNLVCHPATRTVTWFNNGGAIRRERVSSPRQPALSRLALALV